MHESNPEKKLLVLGVGGELLDLQKYTCLSQRKRSTQKHETSRRTEAQMWGLLSTSEEPTKQDVELTKMMGLGLPR